MRNTNPKGYRLVISMNPVLDFDPRAQTQFAMLFTGMPPCYYLAITLMHKHAKP